MTMTPLNALSHRATMHPDGTAFIYDDVVWTYQNLLTGAEQLSRAFLARGVRQGDRVVIHLPNGPEMAVALYACFRVGAIACPTNLRFKTAELREIFQRLQPALYLGEEQLYSHVESIESTILAVEKRFVTGPRGAYKGAMPWSALLIDSAGGRPVAQEPDKETPAVLLTTSGTTGQPKFVTHTPATLSAIADAFPHINLDAAQTVLNSCPMVHATGLFTFLASVNFGAAMVLVERFDPDAVLDQIEMHGCTWMLGLPFMYDALLERQRERPRKVSSLRYCRCGGDVCPIQLQIDFEATFGTPLRNVWGATEAIGSVRHGLRPGPVSRIVPGAQIRLVDDEGREVPRGEVGEFLLRGPYVTVGYWVAPDRIDGATRRGWYRSGDLMRQGEGDELWFVGRKEDIIIRGGSNISPVEVERVLLSHPLVSDAAVFGVPDPVLGQRVATLVQLASGVGGAALGVILRDARQQLADYKVPEQLLAVDVVPRNPLGKVDRQAAAMVMLDRPPNHVARLGLPRLPVGRVKESGAVINTRRTTILVAGTIALAIAATPLLAGAQDSGNKTFMVRDMAEDGQDLRSSPQSPASIYDLAELYLKTMLPGATQTGRNTWTWKGHSINVPSPEHFTDQDYSKVTRQVDFVANGVGRM